MITFKLFLEQATDTADGLIHFDWAKNAHDDTKKKRLEVTLVPSKGGDIGNLMKAFLATQEAKEADEIFSNSVPAQQVQTFADAGFEGSGTMTLRKRRAKTVDAIGS